MADLTGHLRAALWWLIPLVALALVIGWETGWGKAFVWRPAPAEPIAPKPVVASLLPEYAIPGGATGHPEMVQRTLFNPTRRPAPEKAAETAAGKLQRGQFALTGTLMIDGKSTAFLREVQGNKPRRVLAGDRVNGMLVAEVRPDRVKLTLGDESEELLLKVGTNPRPTAPPPAVAAAPAATPPVAQGAAVPAATPATAAEPGQTLAERRRAARQAALEQQQQAAAQGAGAAAPGAPAAAPGAPAAPAAAAGAAPGAGAPSGVLSPDPRWNRPSRGTTR